MVPYLTEYYGNSSSLHLFATETSQALNEARNTIARILKAKHQRLSSPLPEVKQII